MSDNKKSRITITPKKPPPPGVAAGSKQWSATSKPMEPKKPPPHKAPPAAQPADDEPIELWDLDLLYPHPLQAVHFDHEVDADFENLLEDVRKNGIKVPINILPCGAVIDGERRRRVAVRLELKQVKVIVKHDLAAAGEEAIELFLIIANTARRQLSKLAQARLFLRTRELQESLGMQVSRGQLRDQFAKRLGQSGRNFDRYVELLKHPRVLQDAVDGKRLSLIKSLRLMELDAEDYEPILQRLKDGHDVRLAVNAILPDVPAAPLTDKKFERTLRNWLWQAEQFGGDMERLVRAFSRHTMTRLRSRHVERLRTAETLVQAMLELLEAGNDQADVGDNDQDAAGDEQVGDDMQDTVVQPIDTEDPFGDEDDGDEEPDASDNEE